MTKIKWPTKKTLMATQLPKTAQPQIFLAHIWDLMRLDGQTGSASAVYWTVSNSSLFQLHIHTWVIQS